MRVLAVLIVLTQLTGCVVYTTQFEPGKSSTLCVNITVCKKES